MTDQVLMTVAICTYNHADRLRRTLTDLARVRPPDSPLDFLVVDNASSDRTIDILGAQDWRLAGTTLRVVHEPDKGVANARNRALEECRGDYLVFLDDDETPDPEWLTACEAMMRREQPDAFGGRIEVMFEDAERPSWLQDDLLGFLGELNYGDQVIQLREPSTPVFTGNCGLKVESVRAIGGFDRRLGRRGAINFGGEDTDLYRRLVNAGKRVLWAPDAIIHHRIQAWKLSRRYFLDLHYRQGQTEGAFKRGNASRIPPRYVLGELLRASWQALGVRAGQGNSHSLGMEMNVAYFAGYIFGWASKQADNCTEI